MGAEAYLDTILEIWAEEHETTTCAISGNSMAPLIRNGDLITIAHGARDLRRGDIVVFRQEGKLVVHRLLRAALPGDAGLALTKGDNRATTDPPLRRESIVGKVILVQGERVRCRLSSITWRTLNRLLAVISEGSARDARGGSVPTRLARVLFRIRRRWLSRDVSFRSLALGALSRFRVDSAAPLSQKVPRETQEARHELPKTRSQIPGHGAKSG